MNILFVGLGLAAGICIGYMMAKESYIDLCTLDHKEIILDKILEVRNSKEENKATKDKIVWHLTDLLRRI